MRWRPAREPSVPGAGPVTLRARRAPPGAEAAKHNPPWESHHEQHATRARNATEATGPPAVPMRFEVTTIPVADVDRAKAFYRPGLAPGHRLQARPGRRRGVQFTPPGSPGLDPVRRGRDDDVAGPLQG